MQSERSRTVYWATRTRKILQASIAGRLKNSAHLRCGVVSPFPIRRLPMLWRLRQACGLRVTCRRGSWRSRSRRPAVPLTRIQTDILQLLASHRDPESYVAGSTPLNRDASRYSADIDVFHDREERVARVADEDS